MVKLHITIIKYPKNDTIMYQYESLDNLLMELKLMIERHYIASQDIIRIEV